ncbi:uncharacterized protein VTP21DRAFT_1021 [Calcarisporiella thermophila]|uniref:uncharacterized protein n=1 Tax=Calcarisporiella thermophila TaxID=911321 RepID=UPI0037426D89
MRIKTRCPICKSKKWRKDAIGYYVCEFGHPLENYEIAVSEFNENTYGGSVRRKKRLKKKPLYKASRSYLFGKEAETLMMQCLQIILQNQLKHLIKKYHLPPSLERIVYELWLQYVDIRKKCTYDSETSSSSTGEDDTPSTIKVEEDFKIYEDPFEAQFDRLEDEKDKIISDDELGDYSSEEDIQEKEELVEASPGNAIGLEEEKDGVYRKKRKMQWWETKEGRPRIMFTIILIYLGCVRLNYPILLADIYWLELNGDISEGRFDLIPREVRDLLVASDLHFLSPSTYPTCHRIHEWVGKFVYFYRACYGTSFPEVPVQWILQRCTRELSLPVEVSLCASSLFSYLDETSHLPIQHYKAEHMDKTSWKLRQLRFSPCVKLMALTLVALKILYDVPSSDPPTQSNNVRETISGNYLEKKMWLRGLEKKVVKWRKGHISTELRNMSIHSQLNSDELTERFRRNLREEQAKYGIATDSEQIHFPNSFDASLKTTKLKDFCLNDTIPPLPPLNMKEGQIIRSASKFVHYQSRDVFGDYHADYEPVLTFAADLVGIEEADLDMIVRQYEYEFERKWMAEQSDPERLRGV